MVANPRPTPDWTVQREAMVRGQIQARGIRDARVLEAMGAVPRHEFVPEGARRMSYEDTPLPIGHGQTISQPYIVALMTEALELSGEEKVLEVGAGSGYQAAVLAALGCTVHTVEREPELARRAGEVLGRLGYGAVTVHCADGTRGWPEEAPFQAILVTAGGPRVPESLKEQLDRDRGTLVIPVGERGYQELVRVTCRGGRWSEENLGGCRFVPLVGEEGW